MTAIATIASYQKLARTQMSISGILNSDGTPPFKRQRSCPDWNERPSNAASMEGFPCPPPPSPRVIGPPPPTNTTRIDSILNSPESERNIYSPINNTPYPVPAASKIVCDVCEEGFTCDSLLRKHQAKHTKPFKCKEKGCERNISGFTSPNDLKRHENSVHKGTKGPAIGYNCMYDHCRDRNKIYFRLDNFRNHLKKLHSTRDSHTMADFLKQAESECRVEVNPEDAQESATETNCSSARGTPRKRPGSVPVSARKPKKYQWMVTKVDNGNLARPRPAYFGPEDDGSDSAMDIDRPEMETDGPNCQGYPPNMQVGPQEIYAVEARSWSRAVMEREEEMSRRRKRMGEIQAQMQEHRTTLDQLEQEFRMLEMEDQKARVYLAGGPAQGYPNAPPNQELNTRSLKECPTNNNETITRYLQESSSLEPNSAILYAQRNRAEGSADVNMLSPPETVAAASPPGDHNPGADTQEYKMPIARQPQFAHPQQFRTQTNPRHTIRTQQAGRVPRGDRPSDKPFKCIEPGCKSKFAMQCQLSKHLKRHARPYGCTSQFCEKMFGAKGDWKRHENSQHHRLESWKCNVPVPPHGPGDICRSVHYRKENFVNHLKSTTHCIKNEAEIKQWTEDSYIGGSGHHTFWCGFCVDPAGNRGMIIRMKARGLPGWEERFDHIGEHFDHGEHIRTYVYQDAIDPCPSMSDSEDDNEPTPEPPTSPAFFNSPPEKTAPWLCNNEEAGSSGGRSTRRKRQ